MLEETGGTIAGVAMGLPCYGESDEGDCILHKQMVQAFDGIPLYLTNDVEVGWAGSLMLQPGINQVAGTGSICYGRDPSGNTARSGGWDDFYSDEGSGYWLGRRTMEVFTKQSDGRVPRGPLYSIMKEACGIGENDFEFIDYMREHYQVSRDKVATLQLFAEKAALQGDTCAIELYREAAAELALMVAAVKEKLNFPDTGFPVSCSGGVFKAGPLILPAFQAAVEKLGGTLTTPLLEPVEGAVLLAVEKHCPQQLAQIKTALLDQKR